MRVFLGHQIGMLSLMPISILVRRMHIIHLLEIGIILRDLVEFYCTSVDLVVGHQQVNFVSESMELMLLNLALKQQTHGIKCDM